jgi:hypothetical protein
VVVSEDQGWIDEEVWQTVINLGDGDEEWTDPDDDSGWMFGNTPLPAELEEPPEPEQFADPFGLIGRQVSLTVEGTFNPDDGFTGWLKAFYPAVSREQAEQTKQDLFTRREEKG